MRFFNIVICRFCDVKVCFKYRFFVDYVCKGRNVFVLELWGSFGNKFLIVLGVRNGKDCVKNGYGKIFFIGNFCFVEVCWWMRMRLWVYVYIYLFGLFWICLNLIYFFNKKEDVWCLDCCKLFDIFLYRFVKRVIFFDYGKF